LGAAQAVGGRTIEKKRADASEEVNRLRADHAQRLQDKKAESDAPAGV
jgi:hypothetical protein